MYSAQGKSSDAIKEASLSLRATGNASLADQVEKAFGASGYPAAMRVWLDSLRSTSRNEYVSPMRMAVLALRAGDREQTLSLLRQAVEQRSPGLVYVAVDPEYGGLRSDPEFEKILKPVGLPGR